jgi:predicted dienelactone hydrolase
LNQEDVDERRAVDLSVHRQIGRRGPDPCFLARNHGRRRFIAPQELRSQDRPYSRGAETMRKLDSVRNVIGAVIFVTTVIGRSTGTAQELPATCDPNDPPSCLYVSDLSYKMGTIERMLFDGNRGNYPVPILIRYPIGAAESRPVVIWHHGGTVSRKGRYRSAEWGTALAKAGYVVIHPSRTPLADATAYEAECKESGFDTEVDCANWLSQWRFGPQTTHFIIDGLAQLMIDVPALANRLDLTKIVVGGHSGGSAAALANAGAWQQWLEGARRYDETDLRPIAFIASAPQGPMYAGFNSGFQAAPFDGIKTSSYAGIDRPFLFITGVGDETGEPPESRVTAWLSALPGKKVLSWDLHPAAVHETMDIHRCDTALRAKHCHWIKSAGLAFLDAVVRGRPEAQEWIASKAYVVLTEGAIELHRR